MLPSTKENKHTHAPGPKGEAVTGAFTVTWSKVTENGPGMDKNGCMAEHGFFDQELMEAQKKFQSKGSETTLIDLNNALQTPSKRHENASVLVVNDAASKCFGIDPELVREELFNLPWDEKKLMRGQVKTAQARRNLCFGAEYQAPDIANGKGTIIAWSQLPLLGQIRDQLAHYLGCKAEELHAEGNLYHHHKAGIGFHGDGERRIVIAMRFGEPLRLHYQAYHRFEPIGSRISIDTLKEGDLYVMGEKAVGTDWKSSSIITWRHSAERFHSKKPVYCKSLAVLKETRSKKKRKLLEKNEQKKKMKQKKMNKKG
jgi:hypothetical protein